MFEQWNSVGYMLKPRCLWDPTHPLYNQFNPLSKDANNHAALILQITVISGQYVCGSQYTASPFLEIEIIGVQADCAKEKSKIIGRNSVSPVWNHAANFRLTCPELAFLRIAVCDGSANGRVVTQRVVPLSCLRPGYRHLPLRTVANQPLDQSTLFIQSRFEQEELIYLHDEDQAFTTNFEPELSYQHLKADSDPNVKPVAILRRQIFVIRILGLSNDAPTTVHIEKSDTTVRCVIQSALVNAGLNDSPDDYNLFEETIASHCSPSPVGDCNPTTSMASDLLPNDNMPTQRILPLNEPILDSVACWQGITRRFHLRKKSTETGRAWITSIINKGAISNTASPVFGQNRKVMASDVVPSTSASVIIDTSTVSTGSNSPFRGLTSHGSQKSVKSHSSIQIHGHSLDVDQPECMYLEPTRALHPRARSMGETFLLCVFIQKDQYVLLRTALYNNAQDVIKQIFIKTQRCLDDENDFVLLEELRDQSTDPSKAGESSKSSDAKPFYRILDRDENVWKSQQRWRSRAGRFMLEKREIALLYEKQNSKTDTTKSTRKISLSNVRSINLTRRISRIGKALTMEGVSKKDF